MTKNTKLAGAKRVLALTAVGATAVTVATVPMGQLTTNQNVHAADGDAGDTLAPATVNLDVNKYVYDLGSGDTADKNINANGDSIDVSKITGKHLYDKEYRTANNQEHDYGDVGFSLYNITSLVNAGTAAKAEKDGSLTLDSLGIKASDVTATKAIATAKVGDDGIAHFTNVPAYQNGKNSIIVAMETSHASGLAVGNADPIVVSLPRTNSAGDGFLSLVKVAPKSEMHKAKLIINKLGDDGKEGLAGAKLSLYKGSVGSGAKLGDEATSDKDGNVSFDGISVGHYYLVESDSSVADFGHKEVNNGVVTKDSSSAPYFNNPYAQNDAQNSTGFSVNTDGSITYDHAGPHGFLGGDGQIGAAAASNTAGAFSIKLVNFKKPTLEKKVTSTDTTKMEVGRPISFAATVHIPTNISEFASLSYSDKPTKGLTYIPGQSTDDRAASDPVAKIGDTTLKNGVDYKLVEDSKNNMFQMDFNKDADNIKNNAGKDISVTYRDFINEDAIVPKAGTNGGSETFTPATDIHNNASLDWNNGGKTSYSKVTVPTGDNGTVGFGHKFVKESSGLFGVGLGASPLSGAKFLVEKTEKDDSGKSQTLYYNGRKDTDGNGVKDVQWTTDKDEAKKNGTLVSAADGSFEIAGIGTGDYQLEEFEAPTDYQLANTKVKFTVTTNSFGKTALVVKNDPKTGMPLTGGETLWAVGIGTTFFALVGGAALAIRKFHAA